jgi:hypothetical protein
MAEEMTGETRDLGALLTRYVEGPERLEAAIDGLADEGFDVAMSADTWTIREYIHHVVDGDDLWQVCVKAALGNSDATFSLQWYWDIPQDEWAKLWNYAGRDVEPTLALFRANRLHVAQLLQRIPGAWERSIFIEWPTGERMQIDVTYVIEMQAQHLEGHVKDISEIRQAHKL